jgi:hypothetical protein
MNAEFNFRLHHVVVLYIASVTLAVLANRCGPICAGFFFGTWSFFVFVYAWHEGLKTEKRPPSNTLESPPGHP